MIVMLPEVLYEEKYKDDWEFDKLEPWKPKAKPDAPDEVKKAIAEWVAEIRKSKRTNSEPDIDEIEEV